LKTPPQIKQKYGTHLDTRVAQRARKNWGGIQYVEHNEDHGVELFKAVCKLGLEGIVPKMLDAPYKSGPSRAWLKTKNPKAAAATRVIEGSFWNRLEFDARGATFGGPSNNVK
jgi:ATP-dependent DNA ligase